MAAIELARKVIVAAIKAVGQALIAISSALLAAFPELQARFQNALRTTGRIEVGSRVVSENRRQPVCGAHSSRCSHGEDVP